ncbi:uncharacterized protein LOC134279158 [Saccostrea cucullata]|uniref:uncharacterized protein LOC134243345 n=1 Tax=Saccostrea cuccullata TaxID=36930 RepID=UPI002ED42724
MSKPHPETLIQPTYEEIASDLNSEKVNVERHYKKLATAVTEQGKYCHREINITVNKQKSEIEEMKTKHLAALYKHENEIKQITSDIKQSILDLKKILDSKDVSLISVYKSMNTEFRRLPAKLNVSLPSFSPHQINTEQLHQKFGSLSALSISTEEHGYTMKAPEAITFSDKEWTAGPGSRTVNIVKIDQIQEVIRLQGWRPYNVCSTSSGDLRIMMDSDNDKQSKVVRYSGFTEKQSIQFDSEGKPLYSSHLLKYISENRNLDICVADSGAKVVVVVNQIHWSSFY